MNTGGRHSAITFTACPHLSDFCISHSSLASAKGGCSIKDGELASSRQDIDVITPDLSAPTL
jgi:hypothetical protein